MKSARIFLVFVLTGLVAFAACKDVLEVIGVSSVTVSGYQGALEEGMAVQLTATPKDDRGNTLVDRPIAWNSTNTGVANVSSSGLVTAVSQGAASITATAEGKSGSVNVSVTVPSVAFVEITPGNASIEVDGTIQLTVTLRDSRGNTLTGRVVTWTSDDPSIASVDTNGLVRGVNEGGTIIRAESEGVSAIATIEVTRVPVASITLTPTSGSVDIGYGLQLIATPRDPQGNPLTGREVAYISSDDAVVSVDPAGIATGRGPGTATITAESEGFTASASIAVVVPMAWVRANLETLPNYTPQGTNLTGGSLNVMRTSVGRYEVTFGGLGLDAAGSRFTGHVTTNSTNGLATLTTPSAICAAEDMNANAPLTVKVQCVHAVNGTPLDAKFRVLVVADRVLGGEGALGQRAAFSLHSNPGATASYTPNPVFSWNSAGGSMTVEPGASNSQQHNHGEALGEPYGYFTTRVGLSDDIVCPVVSFNGSLARVSCMDRTGAGVNNNHFLLGLQMGRPGTQWGYARVNGTSALTDPRFTATTGSGVTVNRRGVGKYEVVFDGTDGSGGTPAIMLSTFSLWQHCTHFYSASDPVTIEVACSNSSGAFADDPNSFWVAFLK